MVPAATMAIAAMAVIAAVAVAVAVMHPDAAREAEGQKKKRSGGGKIFFHIRKVVSKPRDINNNE